MGTCTGISFVDSTPLRVCRNQRILIHKTFEGLVERGKCSKGWLFGFKLHLISNDKGEILNFMFTPGNMDDREPLKQGKFLENIKGKLCEDKGYIGPIAAYCFSEKKPAIDVNFVNDGQLSIF